MTSATKAFGVLTAASLIASLASMPFTVRVEALCTNRKRSLSGKVFWSVVVCFEVAVSALAIAIGLWLGSRVGLGAPLVLHIFEGDPPALRELRRGVPVAMGLGFGIGAIIAVLHVALRRLKPAALPSAAGFVIWARFLAALAAGIREELWFRFGLMTLLVWGGAQMMRTTSDNAAVLWGANLLIALGFGAVHLPQARALYGLTASFIGFILLLNGAASLAFGWIYWRQGLFAAVIAHCCADLILQVVFAPIAPFIGRHDPARIGNQEG